MSSKNEPLLHEITRLLVARGAPQGVRVHVVLDGEHLGVQHASFGNVHPDRLRLIVDRTLAQHNRQTFDAVNALSKFTLRGIPQHLQLKTNG